jgi:uncharacterized membrane protein YqaE (UPF0057 family)
MFCPRCSAENNLEQKYCRQCELQLTAARIALHGGVDEALARYWSGEGLLAGGSIFLILSVLVAFANIFLNSGPWNYAVIINLLIGLVVTLPMITIGMVRLRRARRALQLKDEQGQLASDHPQGEKTLAASTHPTDRLLSAVEVPNSITEGTTRHLTTPEDKR